MYLSTATLICFDDIADPAAAEAEAAEAAAAEAAAAEAAAAEAAKNKGKVTFTQEQQDHINKILAEERRKEAQKNEKKLNDLLQSKNLTEQDRQKVEEAREDLLKQMRTKEENAKLAQKKLEEDFGTKLAEAERRAKEAETKYIDSKVKRALQDAAVAEDAFNPHIVVTVLNDMVKMVEDEPMIDFPVRKDDGTSEIQQMTPVDAVKKMKTLTEQYGGLFKSNVVSGIGGTSGVGGGTGSGKVNPGKVSMEEYMRLRKENPERLGLPRQR